MSVLDVDGYFFEGFDNNNLSSIKALTVKGSLDTFENNTLPLVTDLDLGENNIMNISNLNTFTNL